MSLLIGQGIGRWGNFVNIEAYGEETTLPWRMGIYELKYTDTPDVVVINEAIEKAKTNLSLYIDNSLCPSHFIGNIHCQFQSYIRAFRKIRTYYYRFLFHKIFYI